MIISCINNYRWSITCIDMLPEYMKLLYQGVLDIYKEMEEIMGKEGKAHHLSYAKESVSCDIIFIGYNLYYDKNTHMHVKLPDYVVTYR